MQFDFYIIPAPNFAESQSFVCRLISKAYQHNCQIVIVTENQTIAQQLDQMLWSFDVTSFIPHFINNNTKTQIEIGCHRNYQPNVLINMILPKTTTLQPFTASIQRVLQIVPNEFMLKKQAREYYRHLQIAGHKIAIHQIKH